MNEASTVDESIAVEKIEILPPKLIIDSQQRYVVEQALKLSNQVEHTASPSSGHEDENDIKLSTKEEKSRVEEDNFKLANLTTVDKNVTYQVKTKQLVIAYFYSRTIMF